MGRTWLHPISLEQLKREVVLLNAREQAELISYTLQWRFAHDADYQGEVSDRLNDSDKPHWLTPEEFERRLNQA